MATAHCWSKTPYSFAIPDSPKENVRFLVLMPCWGMSYLVGKDHKEAAEIRPALDDFPVNFDLFGFLGFLDDGLTVRIENWSNRAFLQAGFTPGASAFEVSCGEPRDVSATALVHRRTPYRTGRLSHGELPLRNGRSRQASPCQDTASLALGTLRTSFSREYSVFPLLTQF